VALVAEQGQTLSAAQNAPTLVKLANLDTVIIKAEISEADVVRVQAGQKASFSILGAPEVQFNAVLRAVEPAPQQLAQSDAVALNEAVYYNGILEVDNPDRKLRIGMTAQVSIILQEARDVLVLPAGALRSGPDGPFVQVLENSAPQDRAVSVGLNDQVNVQILGGVDLGDEVIIGALMGNGTGAPRRMGPPMGLR
jgi:macrolide-specific efflux system membrane fusion protein